MGKHIESIHTAVPDQLHQNDWPGNVRELANIIERAVILCQGEMIEPRHLTMRRSAKCARPPMLCRLWRRVSDN
jgi:DNA-binding NtrC family response regulator